jgi:hypothetical protein
MKKIVLVLWILLLGTHLSWSQVRDVGVDSLLYPSGTVVHYCFDPLDTEAVICNYGDSIETFSVTFEVLDPIGAPLCDPIVCDTLLTDLQPDSCLRIFILHSWLPLWGCDSIQTVCGFTYTVFTFLPQDQNPSNDILFHNFCVNFIPTVGNSEDSSSTRPSTISLQQNHPNPFNKLTAISYALPGVRDQGSVK